MVKLDGWKSSINGIKVFIQILQQFSPQAHTNQTVECNDQGNDRCHLHHHHRRRHHPHHHHHHHHINQWQQTVEERWRIGWRAWDTFGQSSLASSLSLSSSPLSSSSSPSSSSSSQSPMANGGREVKRRLKSMRYIWSIITWPEKPQYSWNLGEKDKFLAGFRIQPKSEISINRIIVIFTKSRQRRTQRFCKRSAEPEL